VSNYILAFDETGAPLLLGAPVEAPPEPTAPDPGQGSSQRRRDAVVDAARTLDDLSPAGVEKLARQRWRGDRPITPEDISGFASAAKEQRVHDVVDALDFRIRRDVYGRAGTKQLHVSIPRGIVGKSLASLDREELTSVFSRLRDKGWSEQNILRSVRRFDTKDKAMRDLIQKKS
jgi:hypothetical protein